MQNKTARKNLNTFIDTIGDLIDKLGDNNPELKKELLTAAESMVGVADVLTRVIDAVEAESSTRCKINRLSLRIFKAFNYTCRVCGYRDPTCKTLSRVRLLKDPTEDAHYISLCKEHAKEFKSKLSWEDRGDYANVSEVLNDMIEANNTHVQQND